jgi:hypothetical protein
MRSVASTHIFCDPESFDFMSSTRGGARTDNNSLPCVSFFWSPIITHQPLKRLNDDDDEEEGDACRGIVNRTREREREERERERRMVVGMSTAIITIASLLVMTTTTMALLPHAWSSRFHVIPQ